MSSKYFIADHLKFNLYLRDNSVMHKCCKTDHLHIMVKSTMLRLYFGYNVYLCNVVQDVGPLL